MKCQSVVKYRCCLRGLSCRIYINNAQYTTSKLLEMTSSTASSSRAVPSSTLQPARKKAARGTSKQSISLKEYTKGRSSFSNDDAWLYELVSSNGISSGKVLPEYRITVCYKDETRTTSSIETRVFIANTSTLVTLQECLASKNILAVTLCHRDSSKIDPEILDLLWNEFKLETSFMRHHFDYLSSGEEAGCP